MTAPESLYASPNALAPHYSRFRVSERLLLTGHSHQAWPDLGFEAQARAWLDAAECVDDKWDRAFAMAERVRRGFARLLDDSNGHIALGANTHELVVRFLSALPLRTRPRIVTTDGEFHTLRRQLDRLAEEGLDIVKLPQDPMESVTERLSTAVNSRTAAVVVSAVFFQSARIVHGMEKLLTACQRVGAELLVDAYHALNVMPFSIRKERLEGSFVVGGGYKYCQLGEGNCFLRFPQDCRMRPVLTGWFSEFTVLANHTKPGLVAYGIGPDRFAGATYDPASHYRAAAVFDFLAQQGLTPELLRQVSQHQIGLLARTFDALDCDPHLIARDRSVPLTEIGGFLPLRSERADEIRHQLKQRGVLADARGDVLRLGPAHYLSDAQLTRTTEILGQVVASLG